MKGLIQFRSFNDAKKDMDEWIKTFKERYDLILGIPRSGMFVASYISTKLCIPLSTPDDFLEEKIWFTKEVPMNEINNVLLVDDGVGRIDGQMKQNYDRLKNKYPELKITKASLYVYENCTSAVDLYYGFLDKSRSNREEWNILHRKHGILASDMDGVICNDWDPNKYKGYDDFINNTEPYLIPKFTIDFIITSRSKKYLEETKAWLKKYKVKYHVLIMSDGTLPSAEYKSGCLTKFPIDWYWESNFSEADYINKTIGICVLSIEGMKLLRQNVP
jgi:uncharacterized HAD superfamily protein